MPTPVLVFGSNESGFHGAGGAGLAMRNEPANTWRTDPSFLAAMRAPVGSPLRVGHRAIFGVARGLQHGHSGSSYAIVTITRPGVRRSVPLLSIHQQILNLCTFALSHPEYTFDILPLGTGYSGYTQAEMDTIWAHIVLPPSCVRRTSLPTNLT